MGSTRVFLTSTFHINNTFKAWGKVGKTLQLLYANEKIWPSIVYALVSLLATLFGQALRELTMTCSHFGRDQICTQGKQVFHRLATQRKSAQVE